MKPGQLSFRTNDPESASGPPSVGEPTSGFHSAGASDGGLPGVIPMAAGSGASFSQLAFLMGMAWACSSCTVVTGNRTAGTFTYASVAGNAKFGQLGPDGMQNGEIDNSTGAGVIERTAEKVGKAYAWGKFWDFASEGWSTAEDIVSDNNDTDVKINASNNATKEAIKTFVPPEPTVPAP